MNSPSWNFLNSTLSFPRSQLGTSAAKFSCQFNIIPIAFVLFIVFMSAVGYTLNFSTNPCSNTFTPFISRRISLHSSCFISPENQPIREEWETQETIETRQLSQENILIRFYQHSQLEPHAYLKTRHEILSNVLQKAFNELKPTNK